MKNVYLAFTILGAVVPYVFFLDYFATAGFDPAGFIAGGFANGAAGGFTADVLISSAVFWTFLASRRTPQLWIYVALNLLIGLSCALPFYLYQQAKLVEGNAPLRVAQ
jgi:hypothetical protein